MFFENILLHKTLYMSFYVRLWPFLRMHVVKDKGFCTRIAFYKGFYVHKKPVWLILFCCSWKLNIDYFSIINLRFVLQEENIYPKIWVIILRTKSGPDSKHWNWFLYLDILHSCSKPPGYVVLVPRHAGII